jgi:hypothetical protein
MNHLLRVTFVLGVATALVGGAFYGCDRYHRGGIGEECYRDATCAFGLACTAYGSYIPYHVCERRESK